MKPGERGITLIEVLTALVVLSIALIGTFRTIDHQARSTGALEDRLFAHWLAENRLADLRLEGLPAKRNLSEKVRFAGTDWTIQIRQHDETDRLVRVELEARSERKPGAVLTGYIARPAQEGP